MSSSDKALSQTPERRTRQPWPTPEEKTPSLHGTWAGDEPSMFEIGKRMGFLEAKCKALEIQNLEYTAEVEFLRRERNELREKLNKSETACQTQVRKSKEQHEKLQDKIEDLQHHISCLTQRVDMNPAFQMDNQGGFVAFKCLANAIHPKASGPPHLAGLRKVGHTDPLDYSRRVETLVATQAIYEFDLETKLEKREAEKEANPRPNTPEPNNWRRIGEAMRQPNRSYDIFASPEPGWGHTGNWTPNPHNRDT